MWPNWSRAWDIILRDCCCSVSMVWVLIPSRGTKNCHTAQKTNFNTVGLNIIVFNCRYKLGTDNQITRTLLLVLKPVNWALVRAQTHRTVQCVSGCRIREVLLMERLSGYNTESLVVDYVQCITCDVFGECHDVCMLKTSVVYILYFEKE